MSLRTRLSFPRPHRGVVIAALLIGGAAFLGCSEDPYGPALVDLPRENDVEAGSLEGSAPPSPQSRTHTPAVARTGRTWYVAVDGSGDVPTIQDAIDVVSAGDEILVGPGRYTWSNQGSGTQYGLLLIRNNQTDFILRSENGPGETILDPEGFGRGMYILAHNDGVVIDGFTFTNGDAQASDYGYGKGGGLLIHLTPPTIRNCILSGNTAVDGGGFATAGSCAAVLEDCVIEDNVARDAGGGVLMINSFPAMTFVRCRIAGNVSGEFGGGFVSVNVPFTMEDCEIVDNFAGGPGAAVSVHRLPYGTIRRSTLFGNYAPIEGQVRSVFNSVLTLESTIIAGGAGTGALWVEDGSTLEIACSDLFGNQGGDGIGTGVTDLGGNFHLDPRFWDAEERDLRLHPLSPCAPGRHPDGQECGRVGAGEPVDFHPSLDR